MYGSCQQSSGITPRYASAAAWMIASIVARSSSRQRRMIAGATPSVVVGETSPWLGSMMAFCMCRTPVGWTGASLTTPTRAVLDKSAGAESTGGGVAARRNAELPGETAGQVALVEKAGNRRRLGQRMAVANEPARQSDPPLQDVSMRRQPQLARKAAKQLVATEPGLVGQACQHQRRGRVVIDPVADLADGSHRPRRRHSAARRIGLHARSQAQERRLAGHRIARSARGHMGEDVIEKPAQSLVLEYRCGECQRYVGAVVDIVQDVAQQLGIDIQHPPRPRLSMACAAVMDFARVHENQAARPGFALTPAAPRCMSAGVEDTNALPVVRVARIAARRGCRHRVDAGQRETVVEDTLAHPHSRGLRCLGPWEPARRRLATVLSRCRAPALSTLSGNCAATGRRTA